jgi:2-iminobutanoate/2-iminopropanoate deaminase
VGLNATDLCSTHNQAKRMKIIHTDDAPKAVGPYSQAVKAGDYLFLSGQVGIDPAINKLVEGGIEAQAKQVFENIRQVLKAKGLKLNDVAKTTVFLKNFDDFKTMNGLYEAAFGDHRPARSTVEVARLPLDALIEVECIAHID